MQTTCLFRERNKTLFSIFSIMPEKSSAFLKLIKADKKHGTLTLSWDIKLSNSAAVKISSEHIKMILGLYRNPAHKTKKLG